jgi:hypothetical protein
MFEAFEAEALRWHAADVPLAAAAWAQIAINIGWAFPCGILASPPLERMLSELGRTYAPGGERTARAADPERVLHVLTECYASGGHTRVVERWVEQDPRTSTILLTSQTTDLPSSLVETARANGATIVPSLDGEDLFARARSLRALADAHDLVILHTHMHDVLPALAFADPNGRPPTVLFEHASHMLWIGSGIADVVACLRPVDARQAHTRRGIDRERIRVLPIPQGRRVLPTRAQARASLGIPERTPVFLTIASSWKIQPVIEPTQGEIASAVMDAVPSAVLLVAGPEQSPQWHQVLRDHGERVHLLGVTEIAPLLAAADVYLDSWPVSGATTILDVATAGLPIVALSDGSEPLEMVQALGPLGVGAATATSPAGVGRLAATLIADPERRATMSREIGDAVDRDHGRGWRPQMEATVAAAVAEHATATTPETTPETKISDWECLMQLLLGDSSGYTQLGVVFAHVGWLPETLRPRNVGEAAQLFDRVVTTAASIPRSNRRRRAVAAPALEPLAVTRTLARMRTLLADGEIDECAVALPHDRIGEGLQLLQAALDADGDVVVDVVPSTLAALARPDDLVIDESAAAAPA